MIKTILGGLSLVLALLVVLTASGFFVSLILSWQRAPETMHMTLIFAGVQFTGWQLFIPFAGLLILAGMLTWFGIGMLKTRLGRRSG